MSSMNPFSWAMGVVSSPAAKKRKIGDVDFSDEGLTLASVMGEIQKLKESNERIESMLKTLVGQPKSDEGEDEEEPEEAKPDEEEPEAEAEASTPTPDEEDLGPSWLAKFEDLKKFKEEHGHCQVGRGGEYPTLGRWIIRQRSEKRTGKMRLAAAKIAKLNTLDFDWEPQINTPAKKKKK